ncbi:CAP domain-containing protein [Viridibacillus arvi]|uniref:CAP domain-containing protein n=1 Tax=Viridibacillus arvi TaxID=263475 RepID=UPI001D103224|nr:CAP domain-containing protein [Viridibacillus sp. JNUCC-6]
MLKKLSVIFMAMILLGSLASPIYAKASTSKTKQVTLTEKSRLFTKQGGYGRKSTVAAKKKVTIIKTTKDKWMQTKDKKWIKNGFTGDYIYLSKKTTTYKKEKGSKSSTKLAAGIYKVSVANTNGWIKVKKGSKTYWIKSGKFVDSYIDLGNKKMQDQIVTILNKERAKKNLKPLKQDPKLTKLAIIRSLDMEKNRYFSHTSPTYGSWSNLLKGSGYNTNASGENIAAGYPTATSFMKGWMNSPGHKANILSPNYQKVGIGIVVSGKGAQYPTYGTQIFAK